MSCDVKALFHNVVEKLYDSIELQIRGTTVSFKQFTDSADILIDQVLEEVPITPMTDTVGIQFPEPHMIFDPKPKPLRCAANTLAGFRCRGEAYTPFTLCTTHWRYFRAHRTLPPGGATGPGAIHPDDVWDQTRRTSERDASTGYAAVAYANNTGLP